MSEHKHHYGRSLFVGGLEVRHCDKDCPATQARESDGTWTRVDRKRA